MENFIHNILNSFKEAVHVPIAFTFLTQFEDLKLWQTL